MGSEISKMISGNTSRYMSIGAKRKDIDHQRIYEGFEEYFKA